MRKQIAQNGSWKNFIFSREIVIRSVTAQKSEPVHLSTRGVINLSPDDKIRLERLFFLLGAPLTFISISVKTGLSYLSHIIAEHFELMDIFYLFVAVTWANGFKQLLDERILIVVPRPYCICKMPYTDPEDDVRDEMRAWFAKNRVMKRESVVLATVVPGK